MPKVKFLSHQRALWRRKLPNWDNHWEDCEFIFDESADDYDYLVVFDEPPVQSRCTCPRENAILILSEPISVKCYPPYITKQYGTIISHQEDFAIQHPNVIKSQTGFPWCYGMEHGINLNDDWGTTGKGFDEFVSMSSPEKNQIISTVCSFKGANTPANKYKSAWVFHAHRLAFTQQLKRDLPELDLYGREYKPVDDKAEAIDNHKYHLVIENYPCDHWWTEKLADCYLGFALPIFHGCPNISEYFPEQSYIHINIYNYEESLRQIKQVIADDEYQKRLPAIIEARQRLLYEHNIFALISRVIKQIPKTNDRVSPWKIERIRDYKQSNNFYFRLSRYYQYKKQRIRSRHYLKEKVLQLGELRETDQMAGRK